MHAYINKKSRATAGKGTRKAVDIQIYVKNKQVQAR